MAGRPAIVIVIGTSAGPSPFMACQMQCHRQCTGVRAEAWDAVMRLLQQRWHDTAQADKAGVCIPMVPIVASVSAIAGIGDGDGIIGVGHKAPQEDKA